jgi:hypothetical protein
MSDYQWRVTKYDPSFRDSKGAYTKPEWTDSSCIGSEVSLEDYLRVEDAYYHSIRHFMADGNISNLKVRSLETHKSVSPSLAKSGLDSILLNRPKLSNKSVLAQGDLEQVIRMNLRGLIWCKLKNASRFFVHFGHDYYMYIGSDSPCLNAIEEAKKLGLFVEPYKSPYLEND